MVKRLYKSAVAAVVACVLCALAAVASFALFGADREIRAEGETAATVLTFDKAEDFVIADGVLSGLTDTARAKITDSIDSVHIAIPNGVTTVDECAFYFSYYLEYDENYDENYEACRRQSAKIKSVSFPESLKEIGDMAFAECGFENLVIPSTVSKIGENAFDSNASLKKFEVKSKDTVLDAGVLSTCPSLTEIVIPNCSFYSASYGCNVNCIGILLDGYVSNEDRDLYVKVTQRFKCVYASISMRDSNDFYVPKTLKNVTILSGIIDEGACASTASEYQFSVEGLDENNTMPFTSVTLGADVTQVGDYAFYGDKYLATVNMSANMPIGNKSFFGTKYYEDSLETVDGITYSDTVVVDIAAGITEVTFREGTTGISADAAEKCKGTLERVNFPRSFNILSSSAFNACDKLKTIVVYKGFSMSGGSSASGTERAFSQNIATYVYVVDGTAENIYNDLTVGANCHLSKWVSVSGQPIQKEGYRLYVGTPDNATEIKNITVPDGVTVIENCIGYTNASLEKLYVPDTFEGINANIISGENFTDLYYAGTLKQWCELEFGNYCPLYASGSNVYLNIDGVRQNNLVIENFDRINDRVFSGGRFDSITIKDVAYVGESLFNGCKNLSEATLVNVSEISNNMFSGCSSLRTVTATGNITRIGVSAFERCDNLTEVNLDNSSLEKIGDRAFAGCRSLRSIALPNSLKGLGDKPTSSVASGAARNGAFADCTSLVSATLGNSLEYIGPGSFSGSAVRSVKIPATVKNIYVYAFYNCTQLTSVEFLTDENGVSDLEMIMSNTDGTFGNTAIINFEFPLKTRKEVTLNNVPLFKNCTQLRSIKYPLKSNIGAFGNYHYENCTNLKTVYIGAYDYDEADPALPKLGLTGSPQSGVVYVAPNKATYDSIIAYYTAKNQTTWLNNFHPVLFYERQATYAVKKGAETLAQIAEDKLATDYDGGASVSYVKTSGYWINNADYTLPQRVGLYNTAAATWLDELGAQLSLDTKIGADTKLDFVYTLDDEANIVILTPENSVREYSGEAWAFSVSDAKALAIVRAEKNGGAIAAVGGKYNIKDVGLYTVYVTPNTGYCWENNSVAERSFTVEITRKRITADWTFDGKEIITTPSVEYGGETVNRKNSIRASYGNEAFELAVYAAGDAEHNALQFVRNVGTYIAVIDGAAYPNYEIINAEQRFIIVPAKIIIDDSFMDMYSWQTTVEGGAAQTLADGAVYVYVKNGASTIYSGKELDLSLTEYSGYALDEIRNVKSSVAEYCNNTLALSLDGVQTSSPFVVTYINEEGIAQGMYKTSAVLTVASDNYEFVMGTVDVEARGLKFTLVGGTLTIVKDWYILAQDNKLIVTIGQETAWAMPQAWTFGDDVEFAAPHLYHGDEITPDAIRFSLTFNRTVTVADDFDRSRFDYYINSSMPSGAYVLRVVIKDVTVDGTVYKGRTINYSFTVDAAEVVFGLANGDNGYASYEWEYKAENKASMFAAFAEMLTSETVGLANVTRSGYWATSAADSYYGGYTVVYNLLRMRNDSYFGANRSELTDVINKPDEYTVYFNVIAPNHAPLTDMGEGRYAFVFTVDVYTVWALPTLESASYVYTGERIIPVTTASDLYYAEFDDTDDYVHAGKHTVTFVMNDAKHYRWTGVTGASAAVEFEITKALNEWIETPDIVRWTEGKYNAKDNKFIGAAKYGDIIYVITDANGKTVYDASKKINKLSTLGAGSYIIKATVAGTNDYSGLSEAFTMRVLEKAGLPWWVTLVVVLGVLLVVALVIFILWKKGVFRILTDKLVLSIRTRATVDATIAAVRANKVAEQSKLTIAKAKAAERAEERKAAAVAERAKPAEEKAAALEEKAKIAADRAEKMRARSEAMLARAERLREQAVENEVKIDRLAEELTAEPVAPDVEAAATEAPAGNNANTPTEE